VAGAAPVADKDVKKILELLRRPMQRHGNRKKFVPAHAIERND
jgi:hypothetical protein